MVEQYLTEIIKINQTGIANEESYYGVISNIITEIASLNKVNIDAITTPKTEDNNKPDIVAKRQNTDEIIGFITNKTFYIFFSINRSLKIFMIFIAFHSSLIYNAFCT